MIQLKDIPTKKEPRTIEELLKNGIIAVNKPRGPTSHMVSEMMQKILDIPTTGHGGTLDPNVTGVLPVALGRATKLLKLILLGGKEYVCVMHLHKEVEEEKIIETMESLKGKITQKPPIKSSVKRVEREREIYDIEILEIEKQDVLFKVSCEAGTYIRKLCHDIGQELEVGAHMAQLVRTRAGPYKLEESWILQDISDAYHYYKEGNETFLRNIIKEPETLLKDIKKVTVLDGAVQSIKNGVALKIPGIISLSEGIEKKDLIGIFDSNERIIALGEALKTTEEVKNKKEGIFAAIKRVIETE